MQTNDLRKRLHFLALDLNRETSLRLYEDTRPHNLEIAPLQKGLVLTFEGREVIEEGMGFGVPAAIFPDKTYFPGSASLEIKETGPIKIVSKHFHIDTVSRKSWRNKTLVDDRLYRLLTASLASTYRNSPRSRSAIFPLIKLRSKVGFRTVFKRVETRGDVKVTYLVKANSVNIKTDFSTLDERCLKVLLLNEQGASFFTEFSDANGLRLSHDKVGAWDPIKADWGCFSDLHETLSFRLRSVPNSRLFRGREHIPGRLAWAGMTYEVSRSKDHFDYELQIDAGKARNE